MRKLKLLYLALALCLVAPLAAALPNYELKLENGCKIHPQDQTNYKATTDYLVGHWVINQLKRNNNPEYLNELKLDYGKYLKLRSITESTDASSDEIKAEILKMVVDNFSEIVRQVSKPLDDGKLVVRTLCDRLLPTSYPGKNIMHTYTDTYRRNYNAPLELADLRLTLGMETLIVIEYFPNNKANIKVINRGLSDLHNFNLKINNTSYINSNVLSGSFKDKTTSNKLTNSQLTTNELSGLKLFPVKLTGPLDEN